MGWDEIETRWPRLMSWRGVLLGGAGLAIAAALALVWVQASAPTPSATAADEAGVAMSGQGAGADPVPGAGRRYVVVYVSGAVAAPGMYRLASGLRVADAIVAAGGLRDDADLDRLPNLAGRLGDGKQVKVPVRSQRSGRAARLDLNAATVGDLEAVPGIDAALAGAIVDFRDRYGGFTSVSDLHTLVGLDAGLVALMRPYLTVGQ